MSRLFDAGSRKKDAVSARAEKEDILRRANEVERLIQENLELTEASEKIGAQLGAVQTVQSVQYTSYRATGSKWNIEHARAGNDYIYQLFPLRQPRMDWRDIILLFIAVMDDVFPRTVTIKYVPPSQKFELKYYTIKVEDVAELPGWEGAAMVRALQGLSAVDAWA